jgi:hydroxymethylbilane synthase
MGGRATPPNAAALVIAPIRVGTRSSLLALRQTEIVAAGLRRSAPVRPVEVVPLRTQGDRAATATDELDFTSEIDRALVDGRIDLAVHSAKDLPGVLPRGIRIAAYPRREDPRDALALAASTGLESLPPGARLGSSSRRRRAQLRRARPDVEVVEVRGNVDTRLGLVGPAGLDGVILALAGLRRIGRTGAVTQVLDSRRFLPAPGQGAIAVTARASDRVHGRLAATLDHLPTRRALDAERAFVRAIGGDCRTPLGALARCQGDRITLRAEVLDEEGRRTVRGEAEGRATRAAEVGRRLAGRIGRAGGRELLRAATRGTDA